jgi:TolB-like protein
MEYKQRLAGIVGDHLNGSKSTAYRPAATKRLECRLFRCETGGETIDSIAVLPFVNVTGDPNTEYLSEGIPESLINSLAQLPQVKVMSRTSSFRYKGRDVDIQKLGGELKVRAILMGRLTLRGESLSISVELGSFSLKIR